MLFSSLLFIFNFLPVVMVGNFLLRRHRRAQNIFLLLASLYFYAWGEPWFVLVMVLSIAGNYLCGLKVVPGESRKRRTYLVAGVAFNLLVLFIFKYLDFFIANINHVFSLELPLFHLRLPIGISFFTFQALSYVVDVYRGVSAVRRNPLDVGLYISLFPQLVAGPIVRYETIAEQLSGREESFDVFAQGVRRFIVGLGKKVLLANSVAVVAKHAFAVEDASALSAMLAISGMVAFTLQIYFDFSGYSDMAIGLGMMFGFHFPENFNYPYIAATVTEFWRRWHISLGTWFRDYVYFPLGGSRVAGTARMVFNLFVTWCLTGLWHGASWNFVAWGLLYFALILAERLMGIAGGVGNAWGRALWRCVVLLMVMLGWVLFRANNLTHALDYIAGMGCLNGNAFVDDVALLFLREYWFFFAVGILLACPVFPWLRAKVEGARNARLSAWYDGAYCVGLFAVFFLSVAYLVQDIHNPFIYFNF